LGGFFFVVEGGEALQKGMFEGKGFVSPPPPPPAAFALNGIRIRVEMLASDTCENVHVKCPFLSDFNPVGV